MVWWLFRWLLVVAVVFREGHPPSTRKYDGQYMGCWSTLKIGNVAFGSWKNGVDDSIMVLFSESEKLIRHVAP